MSVHLAGLIVAGTWLLFAFVWLVSALRVKRAKRVEPWRSRLIQAALAASGALTLGWPRFPFRALNTPPLLPADLRAWLAVIFATIGIAFAFWARAALGTNWSGRVTLKEDHTLIETGPYALVRNPIYTGMLLAFVGTSLLWANLRSFLGLGFYLALFVYKIQVEERFLRDEFGARFEDYRRRVRSLIPFVI